MLIPERVKPRETRVSREFSTKEKTKESQSPKELSPGKQKSAGDIKPQELLNRWELHPEITYGNTPSDS